MNSVPTGSATLGESRRGAARGFVPLHVAAFAVVECGAVVLWLILGRSQWFFGDEWDFIAGRRAGDLGDLFRPHNEHWTTLPILVYRSLFWMFGLRSYLPYRVVVLVLHLTVAALLFVVMRRAAVRPWIAVAAASLFVLFGAGWENIVRPFQMTFTGALVFGLSHLLLADHDGPLDARDWFGLFAALCGLMTSGVAVTMIVVVGLATLLRRDWRIALVHTVPPAGCYLVWLAVIGHNGYAGGARPAIADMLRFIAIGLRATYRALGQLPGVGVVVAVVLVAGLAAAVRQRQVSGSRTQLAAPVALLAGSVAFLAITANGRLVVGPDYARATRYVYVVAALTLPALATAADALSSRWRVLAPGAVGLFLVGVPGNVHALADAQDRLKSSYAVERQIILSLPRDPLAVRVPRSLRPETVNAGSVTIGWLLDGVHQHRIPAPPVMSNRDLLSDNFRLSFLQQHTRQSATTCRAALSLPVTIPLKTGDVIGLYEGATAFNGTSGPMNARPANPKQLLGPVLSFEPRAGADVTVLSDLGPVRISAASPFFAPRVCILRR